MEPPVAYVVTHMMEGVCTPDSEVPAPTGRRTEALGRPRAGKTGTTNSSRNTWFCGMTPDYTCVVWVGYRDNRSLGKGLDYTGGRLACPIWTDFMVEAHKGLPVRDFTVPDGVTFFNIQRVSGLLGGKYPEAYVNGTQPPAAWTGDVEEALEAPMEEVPELEEQLLGAI
jgi:penicillin-binding protein 1A